MSQENVEIVRRLYERWATGDFPPESSTPEVEHSPSDLCIEAERIVDLGEDQALVLSRQTASGKQSGVPMTNQLGDVLTLRDGKIVRYDSYWHRAEALEAVGLWE